MSALVRRYEGGGRVADLAIYICGLGRCGSSLVMQMLDRCGVPTLGEWPAYECEETVGLPGDSANEWMRRHAPGRAIKLLDPQRWTPPKDIAALVLWLDRDARQQAESQIKFGSLVAGLPVGGRNQRRELVRILERDRCRALGAISSLDCRRHDVKFERLISDPHQTASEIATFFAMHDGPTIDPATAAAVARPRAATCFPGLLEMEILSAGRQS